MVHWCFREESPMTITCEHLNSQGLMFIHIRSDDFFFANISLETWNISQKIQQKKRTKKNCLPASHMISSQDKGTRKEEKKLGRNEILFLFIVCAVFESIKIGETVHNSFGWWGIECEKLAIVELMDGAHKIFF